MNDIIFGAMILLAILTAITAFGMVLGRFLSLVDDHYEE